jgi:hypothetical protein
MARRNSSGCGCWLAVLAVLLLPLWGSLLIFTLEAPAITAYLEVTDHARFQAVRSGYLWASAAAPLVAFALTWLVTPRRGRLRGRPESIQGKPQRTVWGLAGGYLIRAAILLALTTAVGLATTAHASVVHQLAFSQHIRMNAVQFAAIFLPPLIAAFVVLIGIRSWDKRPYPVTVEEVRKAVGQAQRDLRRVQAENQKVSRLANAVAAKLASAKSQTQFVSLRNLHYESFTYADVAHGHYRSTTQSLDTMARVLFRFRKAPRQWRPPVNRAQAIQARQARVELSAAAQTLEQVHRQLDSEVARGLQLVQTLNANTADLKYAIRDNCGKAGRDWFEALEERIEAARAAR